MTEGLVGRWTRTASPRGVLRCGFHEDGTYWFAIAAHPEAGAERGSYRTASGPAGTRALLLRPDTGEEIWAVVSLHGEVMLLDGQRWQREDSLP